MARDWAAEFRQIDIEEDEASSALMEPRAVIFEAFAGNGIPTKDFLDKLDKFEEAEQRVEDARAKRKELIYELRASHR